MKLTRRSLMRALMGAPAVVGLGAAVRAKPASSIPTALVPKHVSVREWYWDASQLGYLQIMRCLSGLSAMDCFSRATIRLAPAPYDEHGNLPHVADRVIVTDGTEIVFVGWIERLNVFWNERTIDMIVVAHD